MRPKNKITAFGFHLLFSFIIFLIFISLLRTFWYPEPYFTASGGWQGLKIVAFVDIILGPVLTLVVFNTNKHISELKKDFTIILLLQAGAFSWGVMTVYQQRPIAITFWENSFYTITYKSVAETYQESTLFNTILKQDLSFYYVPKPTAAKDILKLNDEALKKKLPPFQLIERYKPANQFFDKIKKRSTDIHEIIESNKKMNIKLLSILKESNTSINENIYIPLISKYQNIILVFDDSGNILGYIKAPLKKFP